MQTMLVPLDGSALAEQALPFAHLLAPLLGARVVLLQVFPDPEHEYSVISAPADAPGAAGARWAHQQHQRWLAQRGEIEAYLETHAAPLRAAGIEATVDVEVGLPAAGILRAAERQHASLIALAGHDYGRLRRWASGSVTEQLVLSAGMPLLLLRPGLSAPAALARILAPFDCSVYSRHVLAYALMLAHSAAAELVVLHTVAASIEELLAGEAPAAAQRAALGAHVQQAYAAHFGAGAARARFSAEIGIGNPTDAIVEEAGRHQSQLVIIARQRNGGTRRRAAAPDIEVLRRAVDAPLLLLPPRP